MKAIFLILATSLLICSCVDKAKYDNAISENKELVKQIANLQSELVNKNNQITQLESSLEEIQNNANQYYVNATVNQDKGKEILEELSVQLNSVQKILNGYTENNDIYRAHKACKEMEAHIDSYLYFKY